MATFSKKSIWNGFCPVDNNNVAISIEYISFKTLRHETLYIKNRNMCFYLNKGKCNKGRKCPIYKDAPSKKREDEL